MKMGHLVSTWFSFSIGSAKEPLGSNGTGFQTSSIKALKLSHINTLITISMQ